MDAQRREDITGWDAREFSGGFDGLREHVGDGFSGAVTDGTGWLFLLDGRVIGVADGDLEAFSDASGTVYEAPHDSLPVLFAMQEQGGTQRAQYYTNDTSLSEADRKLSQGGFTGYVELAENVLSGDYYVTYTAGESMAAAYVGNSRRLETGEKAFDLADDEVGIYTVYEVDLDVRALPEGTGSGGSTGSAKSGGSGGTTEPAAASGSAERDEPNEPDETDEPNEVGRSGESGGSVDPSSSVESGRAEPAGGSSAPDVSTDDGSEADPREASAEIREAPDSKTDAPTNGDGSADARDEPRPGGTEDSSRTRTADIADAGVPGAKNADSGTGEPNAAESNTAGSNAEVDDPGPEPVDIDAGSTESAPDPDTGAATRPRTGEESPDDEDVFSEEAQWREAKSIPALDPSETKVRDGRADESERPTGRGRERSTTGRGRPAADPDRGASGADRSPSSSTGANGSASEGSPDPRPTPSNANHAAVSRSEEMADGARERIEQLEAELAKAESERESLATERDALREERDSLTRERDELESDVEELETELEELRAEIERLRTNLTEAESKLPESDHSLSAAEARDGTNLFIRYESKGGATLEDAHDGNVGRDELRENLRIEHHTSFETDGLSVDGRPFEEFLRDTMEYGFTRWLVEELPFEVGETGNGSALRDLYDALPEVDRAEIGGSISVAPGAGEEDGEQQPFDLVLRDRMGNPLFVADLNDTRAPTKGASLESLVANGGRIAESNDEFAGAFAVTASFFDPDALEVASDAVGGGLFGRSKRKSFVKLSRKRGYHLCLVESREGGFHLTVPDL